MQRRGKGSKYFRLTEALTPCFSAIGDEVQIVNLDCLEFEAVSGGLTGQEVFDCSNAVRVFNLVSQANINTQAPAGTVVEAIRDTRHDTTTSTETTESFWRILQILSCDCGSTSGSSESGSSTSGSSYSSSSSSYSSSSSSYSAGSSSYSGSSGSGGSSSNNNCIDVVTKVECVDGSLHVTTATICVVSIG
jgi:hypothetical protein